MSLDLQRFLNEMRSPARPNRFQVIISKPPMMLAYPESFQLPLQTNEALHVMTKAAIFPTVEVSTALQTRRYGVGLTERAPSGVKYRDLMIDVIADDGGNNYKFFTSWINYVMMHDTNTNQMVSARYRDDFTTTIEIQGLSESGVIHTRHVFERAYPFVLTGSRYDWSVSDTPLEFTVAFDFYKMRIPGGS